MYHEFTLDLSVARRNAGLTQLECSHLIGGSRSKMSQIERGARLPNIKEICALSLIFGRSFESLYAEIFRDVRQELGANLATLPEPRIIRLAQFNRTNTLNALAARLLEETNTGYDA